MAEKTTQTNTDQKVVAHARNIRLAPRKLRLVANLVKRVRAQDAVVQLMFTNKKGATIVSKLIQSAMANAEHNFSMDPASLYVASITCDAAAVMRRFMPRARGSASPLNRRMSHLHVTLESRAVPKGAGASRFALLQRRAKATSSKQEEVLPEATAQDAKIPEAPKTSQAVKQNKIQQKRRLFNRKSGE